MNRLLYLIPTYHCNLSCPHCHLKDGEENFNREKFIKEMNSFEGRLLLFGGEPTVDEARLFDLVEENRQNGKNKIGGITTNLIKLNAPLLELYKEIGHIGSSWNLSRFTETQYVLWLKNLDRLAEKDLSCKVLITLTEDLLELTPENFIALTRDWNPKAARSIQFEHYIGEKSLPDYYERVDEWLLSLYQQWEGPSQIRQFLGFDWCFNCDNYYTLTPEGNLIHACPNGLFSRKYILSECLLCEEAAHCRPCRLQEGCSAPRRLLKETKKEVMKDGPTEKFGEEG